jgi:hypothetical protein
MKPYLVVDLGASTNFEYIEIWVRGKSTMIPER